MNLLIPPLSIPTKYVSDHNLTFTKQLLRPGHVSRSCRAMCIAEPRTLHDETTIRRSGNYPPSRWESSHMQSLKNPYAGEKYVQRRDELKEIVNEMLQEYHKKNPIDVLIMIDDLQRLGLSYHFKSQIKQVLESIYTKFNTILDQLNEEDDLYAKALIFRLFRQHGFDISQDIFDCFKDEKGTYKTSLCGDIKGMLNLYEATYYSVEGESTLELAREFTKKCLTKIVATGDPDHNYLSALVDHALQLPLHWRSSRTEARWFIDIYETRADMNPLVLELVKLDFNIVQSQYQDELKDVSWWWKKTKVVEKLVYVRNIVVPCFFWGAGVMGEPQYGNARRTAVKFTSLISMVDDTYDVYGTLDELQLFTNAIERWDINAMDQLPDYMKVCFLVLYNFVNEVAYEALTEHDINTIPYLKKMWTDICKAYLVEAKWYYDGYKPTLEEYINNAVISISAPVSLLHIYLAVDNPITKDALETICNYPNIVRSSAMIVRLADDLGTCSEEIKRGDVPKSVQCYMNETGASEEQAREYVKFLILEEWKRMNKDRVASSPLSETFVNLALNLGRTAQCIYEFGDGHGNVDTSTKYRIAKLFLEPILVEL